MTMEDLAIGTKSAKQMIQGGTMIVNTLKAVIETGRPSLGTRALFALFRVMQPFTPKRSRTEHWPVAEPPASRGRAPSQDNIPGGACGCRGKLDRAIDFTIMAMFTKQ